MTARPAAFFRPAQAREPIVNPIEMGLPDEAAVERKLSALPEYQTAFAQAIPGTNGAVSFERITHALASFERTLLTHDRFDDFLKGDDHAFTTTELKGLENFISAGCTFCHSGPLLGGNAIKVLGEEIPFPAPSFHNGSIATLEEVIRKMSYHQVGRELPDDEVDSIAAFLRTLTDKAGQPKRECVRPA